MRIARRSSTSIGRTTLVAFRGKLVLAFTVRLSGGASRIQIDGLRGRRWITIKAATLSRSSRVTAKIRDRAYSRLRIRAQLPGRRGWAVERVVRVPKPRSR